MLKCALTIGLMEDYGNYSCHVKNQFGFDSKSVEMIALKVDKQSAMTWSVAVTVMVFIILLSAMLFKMQHERGKIREMEAAGLANFEDGNCESINVKQDVNESSTIRSRL